MLFARNSVNYAIEAAADGNFDGKCSGRTTNERSGIICRESNAQAENIIKYPLSKTSEPQDSEDHRSQCSERFADVTRSIFLRGDK